MLLELKDFFMLKLFSKKTWKKALHNPAHAAKAGFSRLKVEIATAFLQGYSPYPQNITFFMTYRCNLRCNVCGQWGQSGYVKRLPSAQLHDEVQIDQLKQVIDNIAPFKPIITMCGGETLLYHDWFEFMQYVKQKGLTCILTTNGTFLQKNAEKLVDVGLDKLSLSLDGPEEIHNQARGNVDNVFQKAVEGLCAINRIKKEKNVSRPVLEIGCTISDQNYHYLDDVIDIAENLEVSCLVFLHLFSLTNMEYTSQAKVFRDLFNTESLHWSGYRYDRNRIDAAFLSSKIKKIKSNKKKMPILILPDFSEEEILKYYNDKPFVSRSYSNTCIAPWTTVYVLPNGDISPCSSFVAGNIAKEPFTSIWNNERYRFFRQQLSKRKFFPACPRCCEFYKH